LEKRLEREILAVRSLEDYARVRARILADLGNVCYGGIGGSSKLQEELCERAWSFYSELNRALVEAGLREWQPKGFLADLSNSLKQSILELLDLKNLVVGAQSSRSIRIACIAREGFSFGRLTARAGSILILNLEQALPLVLLGLVRPLRLKH